MSIRPMEVINCCLHAIGTTFSVRYAEYGDVLISASCKVCCAQWKFNQDCNFMSNLVRCPALENVGEERFHCTVTVLSVLLQGI